MSPFYESECSKVQVNFGYNPEFRNLPTLSLDILISPFCILNSGNSELTSFMMTVGAKCGFKYTRDLNNSRKILKLFSEKKYSIIYFLDL